MQRSIDKLKSCIFKALSNNSEDRGATRENHERFKKYYDLFQKVKGKSGELTTICKNSVNSVQEAAITANSWFLLLRQLINSIAKMMPTLQDFNSTTLLEVLLLVLIFPSPHCYAPKHEWQPLLGVHRRHSLLVLLLLLRSTGPFTSSSSPSSTPTSRYRRYRMSSSSLSPSSSSFNLIKIVAALDYCVWAVAVVITLFLEYFKCFA